MASSFKFDDGALRRAAQDATAKLARDLTARLNAYVGSVGMGQPG